MEKKTSNFKFSGLQGSVNKYFISINSAFVFFGKSDTSQWFSRNENSVKFDFVSFSSEKTFISLPQYLPSLKEKQSFQFGHHPEGSGNILSLKLKQKVNVKHGRMYL